MKTIVVVDDEFGLVDVLSVSLVDVGYRVHSAPNGIEGLEVMVEHPPDLVFLDFTMPKLDGAGVLAAMRDHPRLSRVPVVMMSAIPESVVRELCSGYVAFLRKPFDFDAITGALHAFLGGAQTA